MSVVAPGRGSGEPGRTVSPGSPSPLGITPDSAGANVAVWAPEAAAVHLCLFHADEEERIRLPQREGGVWHGHVAGLGPGMRYGLRAEGAHRPQEGRWFDPQKLLIDPYARALDRPVRWDARMSAEDPQDSAPAVPKGIVLGEPAGPDPAANRPRHDRRDLVVYEAHLKGLSAAHPAVPEHLRGTYAGMAHPAVVDHLTRLGVTAVELLPLQAFIDDRFLVERGLRNYWGYQPVAWCAPEPRYALADADAELRHLVHTLHEAGIEVFLDVVYNHTGEGDETGPTLSLRGLHNAGYYRLVSREEGAFAHINDTGTGNTLAVERPMVLRLVLDSLRHWAQRYGIDGFRFDLAASAGRGTPSEAAPGGLFEPEGAFFQAIAQDPVLSQCRLIAEPWDLGMDGYRLGAFPPPWAEWNDRFRDGVRRAWKGAPLAEAGLGSALLGSAAWFEGSDRAATTSVNFLSAHDGFTLADVVSYLERHNETNGEDNRDGHGENHSDNMGVEGPSADAAVLLARSRRVRSMLATLLVSQGTPMLLAGDELGNSQQGNNNAYAQDNPVGWVDWSHPDGELTALTARLIAVRRSQPVLRQWAYLHGRTRADGYRDIVWHRADGEEPDDGDWHDPGLRLIAAQLRGAAGDPVGESTDDVVFVVLNTGGDAHVRLPGLPQGRQWHREVDTARWATAGEGSHGGAGGDGEGHAEPAAWSGGDYRVLEQSVVVFAAQPGHGM